MVVPSKKKLSILLFLTIGIFNLQAVSYQDFAVAFGIVKNYTPNPYTVEWNDMDWGYVASYFLYKADKEPDGDFAKYFNAVAPFVSITDSPLEGQSVDAVQGDAYCLTNYGGGSIKIPALARLLMNKEVSRLMLNYKQLELADNDSFPQPNVIYSYRLPESGKYLNVVHSLSKENFSKQDTEALLEQAVTTYYTELAQKIPDKPKYRYPLKNRYCKLGSAICLWSDIRHFHPHIDKHKAAWDAKLPELIALACDSTVSPEHYFCAQKSMLSVIEDGHMDLWATFRIEKTSKYGGSIKNLHGFVPVQFGYVDGVVYVKNVAPDSDCPFRTYDIVKKINDTPIEEVLLDRMSQVSAATLSARKYQASRILHMTETIGDSIVYEVERPGYGVITDTLCACLEYGYRVRPELNRTRLTDLGNGTILYDASVKGKVSNKEIEQMNTAKVVIYDLRNGIDFDFETTLAHMSENMKMPQYPKVVSRRPFNINAFELPQPEKLEPKTPLLSAKTYFLSSHDMISWGETVLQIVKGNNLGTIVGETSAGTNGNATRFTYPVFILTMTGIRAYNVDGSEFFGIGIKPDIEVIPTYEGVVNGKDEILEYTLDLINANL